MVRNRVVLILLSIFNSVLSQSIDETLQPRAVGADVVNAVNEKIRAMNIFENNRRFLVRWAYIETRFGFDADAFTEHGGIWNVTHSMYSYTQSTTFNPTLSTLHEKLYNATNITWTDIKWEDLDVPLYSGLAIRLLFAGAGLRIPDLISPQANLWAETYKPDRDNQTWIENITRLESESPCQGKMDFVIVLDGSGSIGIPDFDLAKRSVANLTSYFNLNTTNIGMITYDIRSYGVNGVIFDLTNNLTESDMRSNITGISYRSTGTPTAGAIDASIEMFRRANHSGSNRRYLVKAPGDEQEVVVPMVSIVFTDGESDNYTMTVAAARRALDFGIIPFAVGIGNFQQFTHELLAIAGDSSRVITSSSFEAMSQLPYELNEETCKVPQKPPTNGTVEDSLKPNEFRFYLYIIPREGITFHLSLNKGRVEVYFSFTWKTPSAAMNDGKFSGHGARHFISGVGPGRQGGEEPVQVYMSVKGTDELDMSEFTMETQTGDHRGPSNAAVHFMSTFTLLAALLFSILHGSILLHSVTGFSLLFT